MMKLTVSLNLNLRIKGKCPEHPRYNPEHGQDAIKHACPRCLALLAVVEARDRLRNAKVALEQIAEPYLVVHTRAARSNGVG
jgi:hypothetical protein